jgi:hypothetical protein
VAPTSAGDRPKWQVPGRCHGYPAPWARTCEAERILRGQIKTFVSFRRKKLPGAIPPPGRDRLPGISLPFLPEHRKQRPELTHPVAGGRPPGRRVRHSCLTFVQGPGPPRASWHRAPGAGTREFPFHQVSRFGPQRANPVRYCRTAISHGPPGHSHPVVENPLPIRGVKALCETRPTPPLAPFHPSS